MVQVIVFCALGLGLAVNGNYPETILLLADCSEAELSVLLPELRREGLPAIVVTSSRAGGAFSARGAVSVVASEWSKAAAVARQVGLDPYAPRLNEATLYFVSRRYDRAWKSAISYLESLGPADLSRDGMVLLEQIRFRSAHETIVLPSNREWKQANLSRAERIQKLSEFLPYARGEVVDGKVSALYWTIVANEDFESRIDSRIAPFIELLRMKPTLTEFEQIVNAFELNLSLMPPNNTNKFGAIRIQVDSRNVLCDVFNRVLGGKLRSHLLTEKEWRQPSTVMALLRRHASH